MQHDVRTDRGEELSAEEEEEEKEEAEEPEEDVGPHILSYRAPLVAIATVGARATLLRVKHDTGRPGAVGV